MIHSTAPTVKVDDVVDDVEVIWAAEATVRQMLLHDPEPRLGPAAAGGLRRISEVGERAIPPTVWRAGRYALEWAADSLMLERRPTLTWFSPERVNERAYRLKYGDDDSDLRSLLIDETDGLQGTAVAPTWEIWLRFDLSVDTAIEVAAHEVCHLAQAERGHRLYGHRRDLLPLEVEAYQYADDVKNAIHRGWIKTEENR